MLLESACRREFAFILSISKGLRPCGAREGDKGRPSGLLRKIYQSASVTCVRATFQLWGYSLRLPQETYFAITSLTFKKDVWQKCCLFHVWGDNGGLFSWVGSWCILSCNTTCSDKQHVKLLFLPSLHWHKYANAWATETLSVFQLHS